MSYSLTSLALKKVPSETIEEIKIDFLNIRSRKINLIWDIFDILYVEEMKIIELQQDENFCFRNEDSWFCANHNVDETRKYIKNNVIPDQIEVFAVCDYFAIIVTYIVQRIDPRYKYIYNIICEKLLGESFALLTIYEDNISFTLKITRCKSILITPDSFFTEIREFLQKKLEDPFYKEN